MTEQTAKKSTKCPPQSPYKPCRRKYGKRVCGGKFILVEKRENDSVYFCDSCEKILVSAKARKPKKVKEVVEETTESVNELTVE